MSVESEDIKRVLAICFRMGDCQSSDDLERVLSFDMGWMDTDTAHDAIKALIFAGWIKDDAGILSPNCELKNIRAPLGWQPRPSRLTDPVVNEAFIVEQPPVAIVPQPVVKPSEDIVEGDPRAKVEKRLIRYIARQAGIESAEVRRRAERKVKALRYCTIWLALCLISREQGLEMSTIINSLAS
ncbi:MAG: DUF2240 family protein [Euryarchaeota archaeon]|jgi:hypothetical protein|nr:DUF2240 family protein [Euryarchaeota archaeon]MBT4981665.1 DUF2240 family protein [Euryarchaeota archaeon]